MIIEANSPNSLNIHVFKDGIDITTTCLLLEDDGSYAVCYVLNDKGLPFHNKFGEIEKELIRNVTVIKGEE